MVDTQGIPGVSWLFCAILRPTSRLKNRCTPARNGWNMLFVARTMGSGMATYFPVIRGTRRSPCLVVPARARTVGVQKRNFRHSRQLDLLIAS